MRATESWGGRGLFHYSAGDATCLAHAENYALATKALSRAKQP